MLRAQWQRFSDGLWFVPSLIVIVMGALAFALVQLDNDFVGHETPWVFGGDANAARTVLSTIAGSLITVAGLTFSVTMVVLQLASSQFSPRVLPNFLGDRITQTTVGAFVGIFVFCLIGLRAVGGRDDFVPRLTVTARERARRQRGDPADRLHPPRLDDDPGLPHRPADRRADGLDARLAPPRAVRRGDRRGRRRPARGVAGAGGARGGQAEPPRLRAAGRRRLDRGRGLATTRGRCSSR